MSIEVMLALHRFLAASEADGGAGELEVSDSFFFYDWNFRGPPVHSYFKGLSKEEEAYAPVIRELARTGYLDTIHTWGNFTSGGFSRGRAIEALKTFQRHNLKIPIWTNHGGGMNVQGIGEKEFYAHHQGDDIANRHYHLDLVDRLGVRYYALSRDRTWNLALRPSGKISTERARRAPRWKLQSPILFATGTGAYPGSNFDKKDVFATTKTRAGNRLQSYNRHDAFLENGGDFPVTGPLRLDNGRRAGPNLGRIAHALADERLQGLVSSGGVCFLYVHFSTILFQPERWEMSTALEIHPDNVAALRSLAGYHKRGDIWVAAEAILLDYLYMRNSIVVSQAPTAPSEVRISVRVKSGFQDRGFDGLTVEVPKGTVHAKFDTPRKKGIEATIVGPDEDGKHFAYLEPRRLAQLDWSGLAREHGLDIPSQITATWKDEWGDIKL